jgi:hypothetical protein
MTYYKVGKLHRAFEVAPGDHFNLTFTDTGGTELLHTEEITEPRTITHYAVLAFPCGSGMLVGTDELEDWLESEFPNGRVGEDESIL